MTEYEDNLRYEIQEKCGEIESMEEGPEREVLKEEIIKMWKELLEIDKNNECFGQEVHNALYPDLYIE
jgi:hypothetical protein